VGVTLSGRLACVAAAVFAVLAVVFVVDAIR